jgi:cobalt/nickel transport system permease protein
MHIPDGFLATPVWAALDITAAPAVGYLARRAQRGLEQSKVPLLGVMGAFVFAAQMINFPVGLGTSGHLVGAALLAYTLGPAAAGVVLTAILTVQALVFQDGGVLALGANVINMAVAGMLAGYLPFHLWGAGRWRRHAIFLGGFLSVLMSAVLALSELLLSGVTMPAAVLKISLGLFALSAVLEGAITLAIMGALESINPGFVRNPQLNGGRVLGWVGLAAVLLAVVGVAFASTHPDGIWKLAGETGIASHARALVVAPLADYQLDLLHSAWLRKAGAGLAGITLIYGACVVCGRLLAARQRGL